MYDVKMITKESLKAQADDRIRNGFIPNPDEMINIVEPCLAGLTDPDMRFKAIENAKTICRDYVTMERVSKYGGAVHVPRISATASKDSKKEVKMSVREMLKKGYFDPKMSGNTLPVDWQSLWDALRIDISIRKAAQDTIRENFYNMMNMPNSSRIFDIVEFFPYSFVFEENNGEGQAVNQGETRAGQVETATHHIYAVGFTRTLLSELYDNSFDTQKVTDGIAIAYNAKRDDLSIAPILAYSYSGTQQTAASTVGTLRQELLYNTLVDALDDLGERTDPITDRKIDVMDSAILASPFDARHIQQVVSGLPSTNERKYPALPSISRVVSYDGETIRGRIKDTTYSGVTNGTCYLVVKNRYMNVGIKRGLQVEQDMRPDVSNLAREKRSWYFVEGQQTTGIAYFIQEITLPTW